MSYVLLETNDIRFNFVNIKKDSSIILYSKFNIDILMSDVDATNEYKYIDSIVIYVGFDYYDGDVHCHIRYGLKSIYDDRYPKEEFDAKLPANLFHYDFWESYHVTEIIRSIFAKAIMNTDMIDDKLIDKESWIKNVAWYIYHDQILKILVHKVCDNARELIKLKEDG